MEDNKYQCSDCKEIFEKGWSDEEAEEEAKGNGFPIEESDLVCDDCYNKIIGASS